LIFYPSEKLAPLLIRVKENYFNKVVQLSGEGIKKSLFCARFKELPETFSLKKCVFLENALKSI
jgi:hypothetical protein